MSDPIPPPLSDADLSALEALAGEATPGPWVRGWEDDHGWVAFVDERGDRGGHDRYVITSPHSGIEDGPGGEEADAEFICAARTAVPALIADLRAARAAQAVSWAEGYRAGQYDGERGMDAPLHQARNPYTPTTAGAPPCPTT